ncbi:MAG: YbbR-like domain-containing protein [Deltaproteobacteria bacterium]|nr:YbbR-like domain-containing protein [Deltaproteobacteria bacterium]
MRFFNFADSNRATATGIKGLFLNNWPLKLLSLVFASILWVLVVGQKHDELSMLVPLGFKGIPEEMVMVGEAPKDIEVRISGPVVFIDALSPLDIIASIDLSTARSGNNTYRIEAEDIKTPRGIEVIKVRPSAVEIKMEGLIRKELPVKVKTKGEPLKGFEVKNVIIIPSAVRLLGREKDLRRIKRVYTQEVDISGISTPVIEEVFMDISGLKGVVGVEPESLDVQIEIGKIKKKIKKKKRSKGK